MLIGKLCLHILYNLNLICDTNHFSTGKWFDFHLNQLDIKKKIQKKLGKDVVLRIKFTEEDKHRGSVVIDIAEHSHKRAEQELEFESNELTTEKSNKQYKALPMVEISNQH